MPQPLSEGDPEAGDHRGRGSRGEGGKEVGNKGDYVNFLEIDCLS